MKQKPVQIDRDKLRAAVRPLGTEYVYYMLDDAIELLPPAKLHKVAKKYLDLKQLRPDAEQATKPSLLTDVKRFDWAKVLPLWFKVLSATAEPGEYAERIKDMLSRHYSYGRDKMLALARRTATPDQRKALAEAKGS